MVKLLRMEASHNAEAYHVRIDHVLLHHLSFGKLLGLLDLELRILSDALDDSKRNSRVLLDIVLSEVLKGVLHVLHLGLLCRFPVTVGACPADDLTLIALVSIIPTLIDIVREDIIQDLLLACLFGALALHEIRKAFTDPCLDFLLYLEFLHALSDRVLIVEPFVATGHTQVQKSLRIHPPDHF